MQSVTTAETVIEDAYGSGGYKQQDLMIQIRVNTRIKTEWTNRCPRGVMIKPELCSTAPRKAKFHSSRVYAITVSAQAVGRHTFRLVEVTRFMADQP